MSRVADSSAPKVPWKRPEGCWHDFLVLIGWRKGLPRRRPVLTSHAQVCASPDGLAKVREALVFGCPSEVFRWEKALRFCNSVVEPTEALPDPVRIAIDLDNLKAVTRFLYHNTASVNSDGVALMREHLPQFYDKHSVDRAKRVSQFERDSKGITDECFAYGEIEPEVFATIYSKVAQAFGSWPAKANFYDLGCGVGNLVFAAAFIGDFNKVAGIEAIQALIDRGEKRMPRWERARPLLTKKMQKVRFMWQQDDFLKVGRCVHGGVYAWGGLFFLIACLSTCLTSYLFPPSHSLPLPPPSQSPQSWADGTFLFLHWTAFNR